MKSSNKYLLILVAILVLSLGIGLYFKFSPRAFEAMTSETSEDATPTPAIVSELSNPTPLPSRTPLPVLNEVPTSTTSSSDILSSSDLLTQAKNNLNFSEL
jgi:hypothetical protein